MPVDRKIGVYLTCKAHTHTHTTCVRRSSKELLITNVRKSYTGTIKQNKSNINRESHLLYVLQIDTMKQS